MAYESKDYFTAYKVVNGADSLISDGFEVGYGDTVKVVMTSDFFDKWKSDLRLNNIAGAFSGASYSITMELYCCGETVTRTDTDLVKGQTFLFNLNKPANLTSALGEVNTRIHFTIIMTRSPAKNGTTFVKGGEKRIGGAFTLPTYSRTVHMDLLFTNLWNDTDRRVDAGPFTYEEVLNSTAAEQEAGTLKDRIAVYNRYQDASDSVTESRVKVTVIKSGNLNGIASYVTINGTNVYTTAQGDGLPTIQVTELKITGPGIDRTWKAGSQASGGVGADSLDLVSGGFETGNMLFSTAGNYVMTIKDSIGYVQTINLGTVSDESMTGATGVILHGLTYPQFVNINDIVVERACGNDITDSAGNHIRNYYGIPPYERNNRVRIARIGKNIPIVDPDTMQTRYLTTLEYDSHSVITVKVQYYKSGLIGYTPGLEQCTPLITSNDDRGYYTFLDNAVEYDEGCSIKITVRDNYGQEATIIKRSPQLFNVTDPAVFRAIADTRRFEMLWGTSFTGGLFGIQMDENTAGVNLLEKTLPGMYWTKGSWQGTTTQVKLSANEESAICSVCAMLCFGDGETNAIQMIAYNGALRCDLLTCSNDVWTRTNIWVK